MTPRLDYQHSAPDAVRSMYGLQAHVNSSGLERPLLELVKIRASQMNRCAYCLDMHTKDARAAGETEQRINLLSAWREAPLYAPREQAALEWTEAVTEIGRAGVPDDLYRRAREHFAEKELVDLTMAVIAINGWNRLAIAFRPDVGSYRPAKSTPNAG
jgi:AhpD family alkylhydroperoxidase